MDASGGFWSIITIVGPILLGVVLIWALLRNRGTTPREDAESERATKQLYKDEDAAHRGENEDVP